MKFRIHKTNREVKGSCIEIWTAKTRIAIDLGLTTAEYFSNEQDALTKIKYTKEELIENKYLTNIKGLYQDSNKPLDGILISQVFFDYHKLSDFFHPDLNFHIAELTHKIQNLTHLFFNQTDPIDKYTYFEEGKSFNIGDIKITPFFNDHSAFDAYFFLIEANGKSIFYYGDFFGHRRKRELFQWLQKNYKKTIDYLIFNGTQVSRDIDGYIIKNNIKKIENNIEDEFNRIFQEPKKINFIYTSSLNIVRLLTIYHSCVNTDKFLAIDLYTAEVLYALSKSMNIPYPSPEYPNLKVIFPVTESNNLIKKNHADIIYRYMKFKTSNTEIEKNSSRYVIIIRPSIEYEFNHIASISNGNLIYSLWEGFLVNKHSDKFIRYILSRRFTFYHIHTSGHKDLFNLKEIIDILKPKKIISMSKFKKEDYENFSNKEIVEFTEDKILEC